MTNHPWVTAADGDNNLVVDVLRKLYDDSPPPPPPPPPPSPQQDPPVTLPLNWTVRQRRSRPRIAPRPIAPPKSGLAGGASSSNPSASCSSVTAGASSVNGNLIVGGVDESGVGGTAGNTSDDVVSVSKAISTEESIKTTPTKRQRKRKPTETLKDFVEEHIRKKKTLREKKNKPVPLDEPQEPKVAETKRPEVAEPHGPEVADQTQGEEVAETPGPKVAEPKGVTLAETQVAEPEGVMVTETHVAEPEGVMVAETHVAEPEGVLKVAGPEGVKVAVLAEPQETEVARGEIRGPEMVEAGGTEPETIAVGDHDEEEGRYVLPDLNIPIIMDDTFL